MVKETYEQEIARFEEMKARAVAGQDGCAYVEACDGLGIEPEFADLYGRGLAEMQYVEWNEMAKGVDGGLEGIANSSKVSKGVKNAGKKGKNYVKHGRFIQATKKAGIDVDRIMADTGLKKEILINVMGYANLMGRGGRVNILEVKDSRIGEAYRSCYNQARKEHPDL